MEVAFYLPGNLPVYSFSLLLGIGAAVGLWQIAKRSEEPKRKTNLDTSLWVLLAGLIGGRIWYAALNWEYFRENLREILLIYRGGLSWVGAFVGGILTLYIITRRKKVFFLSNADAMIPLVIGLTVGAWLGCWASGCAYGIAGNSWWALPAWDEWGVLENRWPVQLVGALLSLGIYWLVGTKRVPVRREGQAASTLLFGISLVMFALTYVRADPVPVWNGLRWDAWAALISALISSMIYFRIKSNVQVKLVT